jgi:hypothetical protein
MLDLNQLKSLSGASLAEFAMTASKLDIAKAINILISDEDVASLAICDRLINIAKADNSEISPKYTNPTVISMISADELAAVGITEGTSKVKALDEYGTIYIVTGAVKNEIGGALKLVGKKLFSDGRISKDRMIGTEWEVI